MAVTRHLFGTNSSSGGKNLGADLPRPLHTVILEETQSLLLVVILRFGLVCSRGREKNHATVKIQRAIRIMLLPWGSLITFVLEFAPREQFTVSTHTSTVAPSDGPRALLPERR